MLFKNKEEFIKQYRTIVLALRGREFEACDRRERYDILVKMIAAYSREIKSNTTQNRVANEGKSVYYFSMEFLIGKLLENYLINFGDLEIVREGLADMGEDLDALLKEEPDPGLGNGGLGRLAACFIDSLASLGYAGHGNGIHYRYGLFKQAIVDGKQVELADNWLVYGYPWESRKPEDAVKVRFGGEVVRHEENGKFWFTWEGGTPVLAVPYDVPIVGYGGETVNTLRLWAAEPYEEKFDMDAFNRGDYSGAVKDRSNIEAITSILYPNDSADPGKVLRLKQEYLFVAAGLANIVKTFKNRYGTDWMKFPDYVAIHTNDTHPALCGPELIRILIDEEGQDWDTAWYVASHSISYTNHTILPEALEKWPIDLFRMLLPRVYTFVEEIDRRYREKFPRDMENWQEVLKNTAIMWDGQVRMANLSVLCSNSVNGVAGLHTEILKRDTLKDFYNLLPDRFNNKTNGVTHRRFLLQANPELSSLITEAIGDGWIKNADELKKLEPFCQDTEFLRRLELTKKANKEKLAKYIMETSGVVVDPSSVFDVQVKRFHAYKRQLLNIFKIIDLYNHIVNDSSFNMTPCTFIFSGKAAQGYEFAKDVIRLINSAAYVINNDPRTRGLIKIAFIPNFSVSNAMQIYAAAEISEQISMAGMEASGTGNMKFMFNGAITLGTLDGANVEINSIVGNENMEIFGLRAEEVDALKRSGSYFAWDEAAKDPDLARIVEQLRDYTFAELSGGFEGVYDNLMRTNDEYLVLKDFRSYREAFGRLMDLYQDRDRWNSISLYNIANAGFFSSDRTIREYATEIWKLK